jgi:hypothetical protein
MKTAVVQIAGEVLGQAASVIVDAGLEIIGSMAAPWLIGGTVVLIVRGDLLPDECASGPLKLVDIVVTSEAYGRQRISRVSDIRFRGPWGPIT